MSDTTAEVAPTKRLRQAYLDMVYRRRLYSFILLLVFVTLFASAFWLAEERNAGGFWNGIPSLGDFPADILGRAAEKAADLPGHLITFLPALLETVNIAATATLCGALMAIVLSLLATRGLAPWPRLIPVFRRIMDILRAVPEIVIALVLIYVLGGGPVPAMIAIAIHTAGALGKLFSEVNENADAKPMEGLTSVGATWVQRMWLGVIPQVAPNYLSYGLLRLEINVRASAILGYVGAGGIGAELRTTLGQEWRHDEAAMIFVLLFLTIVAFDQGSSWGRHQLTRQAAS